MRALSRCCWFKCRVRRWVIEVRERDFFFLGPIWAPVGRKSVFEDLVFEYVFIDRCFFPNMNWILYRPFLIHLSPTGTIPFSSSFDCFSGISSYNQSLGTSVHFSWTFLRESSWFLCCNATETRSTLNKTKLTLPWSQDPPSSSYNLINNKPFEMQSYQPTNQPINQLSPFYPSTYLSIHLSILPYLPTITKRSHK